MEMFSKKRKAYVNLIKENDDDEYHPNRILIEDCKALLFEMDSRIVHIPRQAKKM